MKLVIVFRCLLVSLGQEAGAAGIPCLGGLDLCHAAGAQGGLAESLPGLGPPGAGLKGSQKA